MRKPKSEDTQIIHHDRAGIFSWFQPSFNESTLFLMALTFLLLFITVPVLIEDIGRLYVAGGGLVFCLSIFFVFGLILCFIHPLINRPKTDFEKTIIALFIMITNGGSGFYSGYLLLQNSSREYAIFPIVNILTVFFVYVSLVGSNTMAVIKDDNPDLRELACSACILIVVLIYCRFVAHTHWSTTFSICVAYSTLMPGLFARFVQSVKLMANNKN